MLSLLLHISACVPAADSSATVTEGAAVTFGSASGDCPNSDSILVDVGSDVAIVTGDSCSANGCGPMILRRQESGASVWYGSCPGDDETYSIAWVVPA